MGKTRDTSNLVSDLNVFSDITNDRIGVGLVNPATKLDVSGSIHATGAADFDSTLNVDGASTFGSTATLTTIPFVRNIPTITSNYTVTTTYNEMSVGPITIQTGVTVTVNSGATWSIV